jgi:hypothetical protein
MDNQDLSGGGGLIAYQTWLKSLGRTRVTGNRWRRAFPWLEAGIVNIFGKNYISRTTIEEFERRARAGEFWQPASPVLSERRARK